MLYRFVLVRQIGVAERRLWVHGLVVHVSQRRDEDEAGARAARSEVTRRERKMGAAELGQPGRYKTSVLNTRPSFRDYQSRSLLRRGASPKDTEPKSAHIYTHPPVGRPRWPRTCLLRALVMVSWEGWDYCDRKRGEETEI